MAVRLRVKCCTNISFDQGVSTDFGPEFGSDPSVSVRDDSFGGSILKLDIPVKQSCKFRCSDIYSRGYKPSYLSVAVNYY